MLSRITLRTRLSAVLTALMMISVIGGGVMIWYTFRMEGLLSEIVNTHLVAYEDAETLEVTLARQKGFVSYYFIDKDPDWLRKLGESRQIFKNRVEQAKRNAEDPSLSSILGNIEEE
jgi:hypothetical protein